MVRVDLLLALLAIAVLVVGLSIGGLIAIVALTACLMAYGTWFVRYALS